MKSIIKCLLPKFIRQRWEYINKQVDQLNYRVINLERSLDTIILSPKYIPSESAGFNGQLGRKAIFQESFKAGSIEAIVETGTYMGNTAGYMAETTGLLVHTCELNNRFHEIAKKRLAEVSNVRFYLIDSMSFLKQLAATNLVKKNTFFFSTLTSTRISP
jgi:protein-L-isoaspartate O-methyltransferase